MAAVYARHARQSLRAEIRDLFASANQARDGRLLLANEYLRVLARKPHQQWRNTMKLRIAALTTGALVGSAGALALAAGPPPSITGGVLGTGVLTVPPSINVHLSRTSGFVMENASAPAGATFGWHSHRTPIVVAVTAGTLTLYDSSGAKCTPHRYRAGQGFIEPANHIHLARNEGKTTVSIDATYVGVSRRLRANPNNLDVTQKRPSKCPTSVQ